MSTEAILGFFFTALFGLPGLIAYLKSKRTKIIYLEEEKVNLYDGVNQRFEKLVIKNGSIGTVWRILPRLLQKLLLISPKNLYLGKN